MADSSLKEQARLLLAYELVRTHLIWFEEYHLYFNKIACSLSRLLLHNFQKELGVDTYQYTAIVWLALAIKDPAELNEQQWQIVFGSKPRLTKLEKYALREEQWAENFSAVSEGQLVYAATIIAYSQLPLPGEADTIAQLNAASLEQRQMLLQGLRAS